MEVGHHLEAPMVDQLQVRHMGHLQVEQVMANLPLGLPVVCMEEAQRQEALMANHLLIHMAPHSLDPMGQEGLEVSASVPMAILMTLLY